MIEIVLRDAECSVLCVEVINTETPRDMVVNYKVE